MYLYRTVSEQNNLISSASVRLLYAIVEQSLWNKEKLENEYLLTWKNIYKSVVKEYFLF